MDKALNPGESLFEIRYPIIMNDEDTKESISKIENSLSEIAPGTKCFKPSLNKTPDIGETAGKATHLCVVPAREVRGRKVTFDSIDLNIILTEALGRDVRVSMLDFQPVSI